MALRIFLILLVASIGLMPAAPAELSPSVILGGVVCGGGVGLAIAAMGERGRFHDLAQSKIFRSFAVYLVLCLLSFLVASLEGTSLPDYLKGLGPNLILLGFVGMLVAFRSERIQPSWLIMLIILCAVITGVRVVTEAALVLVRGLDLSGLTRLSQLSIDALSPIFVLGALSGIALLHYQKKHRGLIIAAVVFLSSISLFSGSRAHVLTYVVGLFLFSFLEKKLSKRMFLLVACLALFMVIIIQVVGINPFSILAERIGDDESGRINEYFYAFSKFIESPVWGVGLGYQVPTEAVYGTTSSQFLAAYAMLTPTVGYLHNYFMFLLMDMGITGLLAYLSILAFALCTLWRSKGLIRSWGITSLVVIHLFGMTEPSLRHIPSLLIIAVVLSLAIQVERHTARKPHAAA